MLGSIVASAIDEGGVARAVRLELPPRFGIAIVVPDFVLPTTKARAVLPDLLHARGRHLQRAARGPAGGGAGDRHHHRLSHGARRPLPSAVSRCTWCRACADILKLRAPGLLGCALSGAGPSILVFYERGCEQVCDLVRQVFALHGHASEVLFAHVAESGFELQ